MTDDYREKINRLSIFKTKKNREIDFTRKKYFLKKLREIDFTEKIFLK